VSARFLFIPVSGPRGMGEYARSLAIATAAALRWPHAEIHFALSREAPYAGDMPFAKTLLSSSPTFHPAKVAALIEEFRPDVVIFDNAGRTAHLRAARRIGARIVYVSSRSVPRRRAFRLRWMHYIDEHWIAYPQFLAGAAKLTERMKLRLLGRPLLRFLNPVLPVQDAAFARSILARHALTAGDYVLIVPGGGTEHPGSGRTLDAVADAAQRLAAREYATVLVGLETTSTAAALRAIPRLPVTALVELMRHARLAIVNGGYTMLQALACDRPCVAVPIAGDQPKRIDACVRAGIVVRAEPDPAELERVTIDLLNDDVRLEAMRAARARLGLVDGARVAIDALESLLLQRGSR
jgi:ADP-heptose:LPS heptosyltransferase